MAVDVSLIVGSGLILVGLHALRAASVWRLVQLAHGALWRERASHRDQRRRLAMLQSQIDQRSAMDEFAAWARLDRQINKIRAELEQTEKRRLADLAWLQIKSQTAYLVILWIIEAILVVWNAWERVVDDHAGFYSVLGPLVSFPLGLGGSVSYVCWHLAVRLTINNILNTT